MSTLTLMGDLWGVYWSIWGQSDFVAMGGHCTDVRLITDFNTKSMMKEQSYSKFV